MENKGRGFTEVSISTCGVQSGQERFPDAEDKEVPKICRWRNNLTALSQRYNLYFVVYRDEIYVYKPQFPTQALPKRPELILTLPSSEPSLTGYIDPRHPHAVNSILVDDLGEEEIIACVCDDGDVLAYRTSAVFNALERRNLHTASGCNDDENLRPFLNENVGMSAWGLAVHKASRMIAVSANTAEITVFAFALSVGSVDSEYDDAPPAFKHLSEHTTWRTVAGRHEPLSSTQRSQNIRIILEGHGVNIPSIAFCNTHDDKEGRWLISTGIDGWMIVWDIWSRKEIRRHQFSLSTMFPGSRDVWVDHYGRNCGWGVMCLDTHAFRLTHTLRERFGCVPDRQRDVSNISASRGDVEDASIWHATYLKSAAEASPLADPSDVEDDEGMYDSDGIDDFLDQSPLGEAYGVEEGSNSFLVQNAYDTNALLATEQPTSQEYVSSESLNHNVPTELENAPPRSRVTVTSNRKEVSTAIPDKVSNLNWPRCPVVHTSQIDIRLLRNPIEDPSVVLEKPLLQNLPRSLQWLDRYGRLNMLAQIPELGIVAVATQAGRVALLTLTRMASTKDFAFRLDAILPFHSQEILGHRPDVPLLGIAVGPIQGRELMLGSRESDSPDSNARDESWRSVESSRRYRLMLTYYDHTVLSYELEQPSKATNSIQDSLLAL